MTAFAGYYDASYPPALWETPATAAAAKRSGGADGDPAATYTVAAGAPGSYLPDVKASARPRNITELREQADPSGAPPWSPGQYVLVGENGKRAHWDGTTWQYGEAPALTSEDVTGTVPGGTVSAGGEA